MALVYHLPRDQRPETKAGRMETKTIALLGLPGCLLARARLAL